MGRVAVVVWRGSTEATVSSLKEDSGCAADIVAGVVAGVAVGTVGAGDATGTVV